MMIEGLMKKMVSLPTRLLILFILVLFLGQSVYAQEEHTETAQAPIHAATEIASQDSLTFISAAREGHTETVQALLNAGVDVNGLSLLARLAGDTPLLWAIRNHHIEIAQNLVANGGRIDLAIHPFSCAHYLLQSTQKKSFRD